MTEVPKQRRPEGHQSRRRFEDPWNFLDNRRKYYLCNGTYSYSYFFFFFFRFSFEST